MRGSLLLALIATLAVPDTAPAEPLGRLFFTPAQRNALDAGKRLSAAPATTQRAAPRGPRSITLNGVVRRSDGEYTVWVNGRALGQGGAPGVNAAPSNNHRAAARVNVRGTGNPVELRVGQQLKASTGKIVETYQSPTAAAPNPATRSARPVGSNRAGSEPAPEPANDPADER
jgi:hypothetical protein